MEVERERVEMSRRREEEYGKTVGREYDGRSRSRRSKQSE
jgi:hypothetical protein